MAGFPPRRGWLSPAPRESFAERSPSSLPVGEDGSGRPSKLETFRLAASAEDFHRRLEKPRALSHRAALAEPKDLAWLLASYARGRAGAGRGGGRCAVARGGAFGFRGSVGRPLRGRQGCALLPFDAGADAVLRRLLRLGAVGAAIADADRPVRLAYGGLALARAGAAGAVPATVRSRRLQRSASSRC